MITLSGIIYSEAEDKVLLIEEKGDLTAFSGEHDDSATLKPRLSEIIKEYTKIDIPPTRWEDICYFYLPNNAKLYCFITSTPNPQVVNYLSSLEHIRVLGVSRDKISSESIVDPYTWVIPMGLEKLRGSSLGRMTTPCFSVL